MTSNNKSSTAAEAYTPPVLGSQVECSKTMTTAEQAFYTGICGNMHPLYVNEQHAASTEIGGRLAFELAFSALTTTALAKLGGPYRRLSSIDLKFPTPARVGDTIAALAEVVGITDEKIRCRLICRRANGSVVAEGMAELVTVAPGKI